MPVFYLYQQIGLCGPQRPTLTHANVLWEMTELLVENYREMHQSQLSSKFSLFCYLYSDLC